MNGQWPVKLDAGATQGFVTGVIGSYRQNNQNRRLHAGIDLKGAKGAEKTNDRLVRAINSGKVKKALSVVKPTSRNDLTINNWYSAVIVIGNVEYRHTDLLSDLLVGDEDIESGDPIGQMRDGGPNYHVHMAQYGGSTTNYLINGFGQPGFVFHDNSPPVIASTPSSFLCFKDKHLFTNSPKTKGLLGKNVTYTTANQSISANEVYGKVDLVINAFDYTINGLGGKNIADKINPYAIGYSVLAEDKITEIKAYDETIRFDQFSRDKHGSDPEKAAAVLVHSAYSFTGSPANPYFTFTNRFREGNGVDENLNTLNFPKDGLYWIKILVKDIAASTSTGIQSFGETTTLRPVYVNNYQPYIESVRAIATDVVYEKGWSFDKKTATITSHTIIDRITPADADITVQARTSEQMQSLELEFMGSKYVPDASKSIDGRNWYFSRIRVPKGRAPAEKETLTFTGRCVDKLELLQTARDDQDKFIGRIESGGNSIPGGRILDDGDFLSSFGSDSHHYLSFCKNSDSKLDFSVDIKTSSSVYINATNGVQPYKYSIDNGEFSNDPNFHSLEKDKTYLFSVKDNNGCKKEKNFRFEDGNCDVTSNSGGQGSFSQIHQLGNTSGTVQVRYEMFTIPDQLNLVYNGQVVASTSGLVSGRGTLSFQYMPKQGDPAFCTIQLIAPNDGTQWNYTINCPQVRQGLRYASDNFKIDYHVGIEGTSALISSTSLSADRAYKIVYSYTGDLEQHVISPVSLPFKIDDLLPGRDLEISVFENENNIVEPKIDVFPNPTTGSFILKFSALESSTASLTVTDIKGTDIVSSELNVNPGINKFPISLPKGLTDGSLIIRVQEGQSVHVKKFIFQR